MDEKKEKPKFTAFVQRLKDRGLIPEEKKKEESV